MQAADPTPASSGKLDLLIFAGAIGLSGALLFTLELLSGRLVLPVFGGSPAVWTTALLFYTAMIFAGYAYAHRTAAYGHSPLVRYAHVALLAVAASIALLTSTIDPRTLLLDALPDALGVLVVLSVLVGLPAFAFGTTTPLLSSWYARSGRDPWFLYAMSNAASLGALLAYPLTVEPRIGIAAQRSIVVIGIFALVVVVALAARRTAAALPAPATEVSADPPPRTSRRHVLTWLYAAAIPAGLMAAVTTFVSTDLASAPLLWIGPLSLYLASFVIAFSSAGRRIVAVADRLVPTAAMLLWVPWIIPIGWPVPLLMGGVLGSFFILAISIHGRLALARPHVSDLTRFYLVLSGGGVLATGFVALIAPQIFDTVLEFPLLLLGGLVARALLPDPSTGRSRRRAAVERFGPAISATAVAALVIGVVDHPVGVLIVGTLALGSVIALISLRPPMLAIGTAAVVTVLAIAAAPSVVVRERTFFGVIEVRELGDGEAHAEYSGTTLHGLQFRDPERRDVPAAYYLTSGPFGELMADLRERTGASADIGVVGLGIGSIATYGRAGDHLTFLEIDDAVIRIASDPDLFSHLADSPATIDIQSGDGRLLLEVMPEGSFDLLIMDAFSSDAVPTHLITREAMIIAERTVRPGGLVVFQVSNRHYDLRGAIAATAGSIGLESVGKIHGPTAEEVDRLAAQPTSWVAVGSTPSLAGLRAAGWTAPEPGPVLTDDYADLLSLLRLGR